MAASDGDPRGATRGRWIRPLDPPRRVGDRSERCHREAEALARAGVLPDYRDAPDAPVDLSALGNGPAVDGLHRCMLAVRAIQAGARVAVVVEAGTLASVAVVFSAPQ